MIALGVLNAALTCAIGVVLAVGLLHAGVMLEVRGAWSRAAVCWFDGFLHANFGAYERLLRPAGAAYFCWY